MARSRPETSSKKNEALLKHLGQLGWSMRGFALRVRDRCQAVGLPHTGGPVAPPQPLSAHTGGPGAQPLLLSPYTTEVDYAACTGHS